MLLNIYICCLVIPVAARFVGLILLFNRRLLMVTSFLVICTLDILNQRSSNCGMQVVLQESFFQFSASMFLSWQGSFGQGSKVVCCFSFPTLWICPSSLKKKDILLSIMSIFTVCCPGKEGRKPPVYPEKKGQFTLLALMKPPLIKVLSRVSCLSLWRKINQSKE